MKKELLVLAMITLSLAACGKGQEQAAADAPRSESDVAKAEAAKLAPVVAPAAMPAATEAAAPAAAPAGEPAAAAPAAAQDSADKPKQ